MATTFRTQKEERKEDLMSTSLQRNFIGEQDCWITLTLSAAGLRTINKMGLDAAIKQAAGNGYLTEIKMLY